jgi:hypothetical protein
MMEISGRGFENIEKGEKFISHPLKGYLRGWVCYNMSTWHHPRVDIWHADLKVWVATWAYRWVTHGTPRYHDMAPPRGRHV